MRWNLSRYTSATNRTSWILIFYDGETRREGERLVQDAVSIAERAGVPVSVEVDRPVNP